jgi:hypothetical protein
MIPEKPAQNEEIKVEEVFDHKEDVKAERTWIEEIEVAGSQLVERVKEVVAEGNVRRLIIRSPEDKVWLEIPLTAGAVVGGVVTLWVPLLAALGALAALIANVKIQIVRVEGPEE